MRAAAAGALSGLYQGRPLTGAQRLRSFAMPDRITIFQGPHERMARGPAAPGKAGGGNGVARDGALFRHGRKTGAPGGAPPPAPSRTTPAPRMTRTALPFSNGPHEGAQPGTPGGVGGGNGVARDRRLLYWAATVRS